MKINALWGSILGEIQHGMHNLGVMYLDGKGGLPLDKAEAAKLFLKSGNIGTGARLDF